MITEREILRVRLEAMRDDLRATIARDAGDGTLTPTASGTLARR